MHRRHTRRKVLAIYLRAQASILWRRVHSRVGRLIRKPRIRALVIDRLRMHFRMRGTEELRRRFRIRRSRLRRGFHLGPRRDLHRLVQQPTGFILGDRLCVPARARRVFSRDGDCGRTSAGAIQSPKVSIALASSRNRSARSHHAALSPAPRGPPARPSEAQRRQQNPPPCSLRIWPSRRR
jgi:hypothetical protein